VSFYPDEYERIEDALLILIGVPPSELQQMSIQQRNDVLAIHEAREALKRGKMPGEK
jgi:hypothetical protein